MIRTRRQAREDREEKPLSAFVPGSSETIDELKPTLESVCAVDTAKRQDLDRAPSPWLDGRVGSANTNTPYPSSTASSQSGSTNASGPEQLRQRRPQGNPAGQRIDDLHGPHPASVYGRRHQRRATVRMLSLPTAYEYLQALRPPALRRCVRFGRSCEQMTMRNVHRTG